MTVEVVIQPEAEDDLREAYLWYEARRTGLGDAMMDEADLAFKRIVDAPARPRALHRGSRRFPLRRFPYVVIYLLRGDRVYVLGVLHERRNPRLFRSRVRHFGDA